MITLNFIENIVEKEVISVDNSSLIYVDKNVNCDVIVDIADAPDVYRVTGIAIPVGTTIVSVEPISKLDGASGYVKLTRWKAGDDKRSSTLVVFERDRDTMDVVFRELEKAGLMNSIHKAHQTLETHRNKPGDVVKFVTK